MKKVLFFVFTIMIALMFVSCGGNNADENNNVAVNDSVPVINNSDNVSDIDLLSLRDSIINEINIKDPIMVETSRLKNLYGIEEQNVKQSACFVTMDGVFPAEIIMIEAISSDLADEIAGMLQNRLNEVKIQSQSYDPENYKLAQQCTVDVKGNFVSMFLTPQHKEIKGIYNAYIK